MEADSKMYAVTLSSSLSKPLPCHANCREKFRNAIFRFYFKVKNDRELRKKRTILMR
jgi:hypothetical protein